MTRSDYELAPGALLVKMNLPDGPIGPIPDLAFCRVAGYSRSFNALHCLYLVSILGEVLHL